MSTHQKKKKPVTRLGQTGATPSGRATASTNQKPWNFPRDVSADIWYYVNPSGSVDLVLRREGQIVSRRLQRKQILRIAADAVRRRQQALRGRDHVR